MLESKSAMNKKGKAYLVGAGPGDIGLLTIKGAECLRKADVVVYDFHLNAQLLNYVRPEAEFIYAGKRGGHHTMGQEDINKLLVDRTLAGKTVCRLKGGDPFVFGRGGEEAEALVAAGVKFEVVPGVSSSVAAPAYAGIPLTHRKYSSSFAVIPGYEDLAKNGATAINWKQLATGVGTLVFLMAVKNLHDVTAKLMENGRPADTPVAVVRWGTRPEQKTIVSTLRDIASVVAENEIKPPAVMVVGDVVKLRDTLRWYEDKPLFGHRILLTREDKGGFGELEELGAEIMEFPSIELRPPDDVAPLDECLNNTGRFNWLVFTSANAVKYFFQRLGFLKVDIRALSGLRICAIGPKTAAAVEKFCLRVDMVPDEFRAEGLIKAFSGMGTNPGELKILLPRAQEAREVFPQKVRELGGYIETPAAYMAVKPEVHGKRLRRFLKEGRITIAVFASGAAFTNFMEMMDGASELLQDVAIAVIGPITARRVQEAGFKVQIMAAAATMESLAAAIKQWALARK